jgi:hypothetical protein
MPDKKVTLERRYTNERQLERLAAPPDGARFRFYGAPPPGAERRHELHKVVVTGYLPDPPKGGADAQ